MSETQQSISNYQALLAKIDAKFTEIRARNAARMQCQRGCHGCCKPQLTVSGVEAEALRLYLKARPKLANEMLELELQDPHEGARCAFLTAGGACGIYDARPIVCRSHGVPIQFKTEIGGGEELDRPKRDVCPLNFKDLPLAEIPGLDVVNLDTLNTILALINSQFSQSYERTPLRPSALIRTES